MNTSQGNAPFDFYPYNPSATAGWIFLVIFAIASVVHLVILAWTRTWSYIPFLMGCVAEVGGYYGRATAHNHRRASQPYLLQLFLIILATPLLSASIYMTLSRLVRALDAKHHLSVRWVSKVYILVDIACLVLQVMGTVMAAYGDDDQKKNSMYYISGGLIFQLLAFVVFMGLVAKLHRHLQLQPTDVAQERRIHWRRVVWALYASSALVLVRNLVRVVEFLQGSDGEVISNEVYLYVFDAVPMTIVVLVLAACHPGWLFRAARKVCEGAVLDSAQVPLTMEDQASRK